ncbi:MAG: heme biosynthesis protein HemY [Zoogloeaceae bacterium]|jgi:HemY protein|nr:heme biosynthesis protein HemY [Zoogloeaceae bacterium]
MRGLFWILGLFFLAVCASLLAQHNDGLVLVVLPPWRADFSLNLLILVLLAAFILGYVLIRSLLFTLGLPKRARAYRVTRQKEQAGVALEEAIRLLFEGRFGQALRRAEAGWKTGHMPGTSALIAARAAQRLRETEKLALWLERVRVAPEAQAAALMIEAEMAVELGDFQTALLRLQELERQHGRHIAALRLELRARQQLGDASGVLKLTRQLEKRGGLQAGVAQAIRVKAHQEALGQRQGDAAQLLEYFNGLRREERTSRLALAVARSLHRLNEDDHAAPIIEAALAEGEWSSELVALYGQLGSASGKTLIARIARADEWLCQHPEDSHLLLALGRLCERQKLWGKAQSYLEASLALGPSRAGFLTLARLQDGLGNTAEANRYFRQAAEIDKI